MKDGPGNINEITTVLAFCEASSAETKQAIAAAMEPIGSRFLAAAKAKGEEEPDIAFGIASESSDLATQIRSVLQMPQPQAPQLMILDIPDDGGFYEGPKGDITEEVVAKFVADYQAKSLTR